MNERTKPVIIGAFVLLIGLGAAYLLSLKIDAVRPALPAGYEDEELSLRAESLKGYSLGAEGLIADWYWMQSLQYIGTKILRNPGAPVSIEDLTPLNPTLLYPYLEKATTFDPRFKAPYYYGAIVLPAIDKQKAVLIAEKGIRDNPDDWRLYQYLGYIYWRLGDYDKAADVYDRGSKIPGAPIFFTMMKATVKSEGGSRTAARAIYRQMYDAADSDQTREMANLRILWLDSLDERDAIRQVLERYRTTNGRCPSSLREILPQLRSVTLPAGAEFHLDRSNDLTDPTGVPYIFDASKCEINIDRVNTRIPE